jgi:hypothetical protein
MKKQSSLHINESVVVYLIAALLFTLVMVVAFVSWQG